MEAEEQRRKERVSEVEVHSVLPFQFHFGSACNRACPTRRLDSNYIIGNETLDRHFKIQLISFRYESLVCFGISFRSGGGFSQAGERNCLLFRDHCWLEKGSRPGTNVSKRC